MKRTIILDPEADRDIEAIFDYLADRNIDAALRFLKATDDTFNSIAEISGIGSPRRFKNSKLVGVRMWPIEGFSSYLAFYLTSEETIRVLRVLHSARNIDAIFTDVEA